MKNITALIQAAKADLLKRCFHDAFTDTLQARVRATMSGNMLGNSHHTLFGGRANTVAPHSISEQSSFRKKR